jgi:hypothetical protein
LSQDEVSRSFVIQQSLSKEWFLARQSYSQFASDAIAESLDAQLTGPFSAASCPTGPIASDFAPAVALRWNDVNVFLQHNVDVNCQATISPTLELGACGAPCAPYGDVRSQQDVFVELICSKTIGGVHHQLAYPFTLNKKIELSWNAALSQCHALVSDNIASPPLLEIDATLT